MLAAAAPPGCGRGSGDELRLRARVVRPQPDTIRFATPAVARRCGDGRGLLLEGVSERGYGALVLLRYGDSLIAGTYPLLATGDSLPRAHVAARYLTEDVPHGFALDSGGVDVSVRADRRLDARVTGTGLEGTVRLELDAEYRGVALPAPGDTVACDPQR